MPQVFTQITLPDTGVEMVELIRLGVVAVGAVGAIAVGGFFAFLIIKKGFKWLAYGLVARVHPYAWVALLLYDYFGSVPVDNASGEEKNRADRI